MEVSSQLRFQTAHRCLTFQIRYKKVELVYIEKLAAGQDVYVSFLDLAGRADAACQEMGELCLLDPSGARAKAFDCAKRLHACVEICDNLNEELLKPLARAAREAGLACLNLAKEPDSPN